MDLLYMILCVGIILIGESIARGVYKFAKLKTITPTIVSVIRSAYIVFASNYLLRGLNVSYTIFDRPIDLFLAAGATIIIGEGVNSSTKYYMQKYSKSNEVIPFFITTIRFIYLFVFFDLLLEAFGVNTGKVFLGAGGALALIIGFGFKDFISNFAAGLWIMIVDPFDIGDEVIISGNNGKIKEITAMSTVLESADDSIVYIPNKNVWNNTIVVKRHESRKIHRDI